MKIILTITDSRGRNVIFVSDSLKVYSIRESIVLVQSGQLKQLFLIRRGNSMFLRSPKKTPLSEQLDQLSLSPNQLYGVKDDLRPAFVTQAFRNYWNLFERSLMNERGVISIGGIPRISKTLARLRIVGSSKFIFGAGRRFDIDAHLLAAILIDEITRSFPVEPIADVLATYVLGSNASAGIAQVKIETARNLIKKGYYQPNSLDKKLSVSNIAGTSRTHLYTYVKQPKHSIFFAAARIRALIDEWKKYVDLTRRPEIIATLYSLPYRKPNAHPQPNQRGLQIVREFYPLARKWLPRP